MPDGTARRSSGCRRSIRSGSTSRCLRPTWDNFKEGSPIEITVDAFRGEVFNGEVEAFDARLSSNSRTLMVARRDLRDPDAQAASGMFANAAVLAGEPKDVVTVPRTALTYTLYGDSVWVVKEGPPQPAPPAPTASSDGVASAAAADATTQWLSAGENSSPVQTKIMGMGWPRGERCRARGRGYGDGGDRQPSSNCSRALPSRSTIAKC